MEVNKLFIPSLHAIALLEGDEYITQPLLLLVFISLEREIDKILQEKDSKLSVKSHNNLESNV